MLTTLEFVLAKYGITLRDEDGQGLIEYVLIAALIAVAAIIGMNVLGPQLNTSFTNVAGEAAIP
jgi:pilus assembly protein Flp/PilA